PRLELAFSAEVEAVQENAAVGSGSSLAVVAAKRVAKLPDVARDGLRIETEVARRQYHVGVAERQAERVDELLQRGTGALLVALRPKQRGRRVARDPAITGVREQRQERERFPL